MTMRRGFTLIELLLASSALAALLGILWSVMVLLTKMETGRLQHTEQQRIVRKWTETLSDDFRSAIQDTEQLNKTEGGETIRHFGVSGTTTQLRIDVTDFSWRSAESSELRTITYEFHQSSGLVRRERDYAALKSVEGAMEITPEIVSGQFRYFDGGTWHEHWSSLDRKSAPSAVEVTFYSLPRYEAARWRSRIPDAKEPALNKVIVQVPAASHAFESYQRVQAPQPPPQNLPPPSPPSFPSPPQPPQQPPPSPFHSLFGDD